MASQDPTDLRPGQHANGPWRLLILDRDPEDPRWLLATIVLPSDVRPAALDAAGRYTDWPEVTAWVDAQVGRPVRMVPVADALAWHITEGRQPR